MAQMEAGLKYKLRLVRDEDGYKLKPVVLEPEADVSVWGGWTDNRKRTLDMRNSNPVPRRIFSMEVRPEDGKDQPGFYLDPTTAAECSDFLRRTLEMEAEFQEHATGVITLPFDRDTLKEVTDAMYTRVLRVEGRWQALSCLRVASYLQSPGLRDALINDYFDKHVFGESCLEPYYALRRWFMARDCLDDLNPDEAEVYQPFVRFEARTRAYVLQHFDAAVTSFLLDDDTVDYQPQLSELDTLLLDPSLQCCNEDNVFRLLQNAVENSKDPNLPSLSELCRRYLRPELMHPTMLLHLIRTNALEKWLEPWLYDCLNRGLSRGFNTTPGCPPVPSGRTPPPKLPYDVEFMIEGVEILAEVEDRRKQDKDFKFMAYCFTGLPFQGAFSTAQVNMQSTDSGVFGVAAICTKHPLNPSLRGITRYSRKLTCAYSSKTGGRSLWNCKLPDNVDRFFAEDASAYRGPFFALDRIPALPGPNNPPLPPTSLKYTLTFEEFAEVHETYEQLVLRPEPPLPPAAEEPAGEAGDEKVAQQDEAGGGGGAGANSSAEEGGAQDQDQARGVKRKLDDVEGAPGE